MGLSLTDLAKVARTSTPDGAGSTSAIKRRNVYDGLGRIAGSTIEGDSQWSCVTYDARGRVVSTTDRAGITATANYATIGQVTENYTDSSGTARSTVAKVDLLGRPTSYTDELATTSRAVYDQAGRVTGTYRKFAGQTETQLTAAAYDDAGRPTSMTEYTSGTGRTTTSGYDTAGRAQTTTRPNGVVSTTTYDPNHGDVATLSHKQGGVTELSPWTYTRSAAGRVTSEATTGRTRAFTYDAAGRLTTTNENSGTTIRNYAFDANTNRCALATTCGTPTFTYDNADRITASPYASAYSYDYRGNLSGSTGTAGNPSMRYDYDAQDHASVIDDGTSTTIETLAPSGRVLRRVVVTNTTGAITEDLAYGYDGPGDSPAYQIPTPASWGWPTTLTDTWPALHDAPWNPARWDTDKSGTAAIETENTSGELYVSGSGDARVAARGPLHSDAEVNLTFKFSNLTNRSGFRTGLRGCSTTPACNGTPMNSGYRVDVVSDQSTVSVRRIVGGSHTTIGSFSYSKTADTNYRLRVQLSDYTISVKLWKATDPEPGTWTYTVTDTDNTNRIGGTGRLHLHHNGTSSSRSVFIDDLALRVPAPAPTQPKSTKTYIGGPDGLLVTDDNGTPTYPLANAHGDLAGTTNATDG